MSTSLTDDQIQLKILELLYKRLQEHPRDMSITNHDIAKDLSITVIKVDSNLYYLDGKGLVRNHRFTGGGYFVKITSSGCDVVKHKNMYANQFPFIAVTIQSQSIGGNAYGVVQADGNAQVTINQQQAFQQAYSQIENSNLKQEERDSLQGQVKELEKELQKGANGDSSIIRTIWAKVKKSASWLIPTLIQVVTEGIRIARGVP